MTSYDVPAAQHYPDDTPTPLTWTVATALPAPAGYVAVMLDPQAPGVVRVTPVVALVASTGQVVGGRGAAQSVPRGSKFVAAILGRNGCLKPVDGRPEFWRIQSATEPLPTFDEALAELDRRDMHALNDVPPHS